MTRETPSKVKRRQWDLEDMEAAMRAVWQGGLIISAAAQRHHVPRKTFDNHIKGRVEHGTNPGPSTVLTAEEEGALGSYLLFMAEHGFPLTSNTAKGFVWVVAVFGCE